MKYTQYSFIVVTEKLSDMYVSDGVVYVCEDDQVAQFKCPCGCGEIIYLNLIPDENPLRNTPRWKVEGNTIRPSINRTRGCKSHFEIINGIVIPSKINA